MLPDVGMVKMYSKPASVDLGWCMGQPSLLLGLAGPLFAWTGPPPSLHGLP